MPRIRSPGCGLGVWPSSPPEWNAYVESGKDLAERRARLDQVPEDWREGVKRHVGCLFAIRKALAHKKCGII